MSIAFAMKVRQGGRWTAKRGVYGSVAGVGLQIGEPSSTPPTRIEPELNSIKVRADSMEYDQYTISIETTEGVSPAMLHTTARLLEGLGCAVIQTLSINDEGTDDEHDYSHLD